MFGIESVKYFIALSDILFDLLVLRVVHIREYIQRIILLKQLQVIQFQKIREGILIDAICGLTRYALPDKVDRVKDLLVKLSL